jgi:hypothetical protein
VVARAITLGASPALSKDAVEQLCRIVATQQDDIARIVAKFPKKCPRRLGLTWALLLTAEERPAEYEMKVFKHILTLLHEAKPDPSDTKRLRNGVYHRFVYNYDLHIEELVAELEKRERLNWKIRKS